MSQKNPNDDCPAYLELSERIDELEAAVAELSRRLEPPRDSGNETSPGIKYPCAGSGT